MPRFQNILFQCFCGGSWPPSKSHRRSFNYTATSVHHKLDAVVFGVDIKNQFPRIFAKVQAADVAVQFTLLLDLRSFDQRNLRKFFFTIILKIVRTAIESEILPLDFIVQIRVDVILRIEIVCRVDRGFVQVVDQRKLLVNIGLRNVLEMILYLQFFFEVFFGEIEV